MCYFLKLWFKVQVSFWGKINEDDLVKNLQETACVEVRLHTQYFDKNRKIRKIRKIDGVSEKEMQSIVCIYIFMDACVDGQRQ